MPPFYFSIWTSLYTNFLMTTTSFQEIFIYKKTNSIKKDKGLSRKNQVYFVSTVVWGSLFLMIECFALWIAKGWSLNASSLFRKKVIKMKHVKTRPLSYSDALSTNDLVPNSIDFYKGIFLHVIPVRVIVPWL